MRLQRQSEINNLLYIRINCSLILAPMASYGNFYAPPWKWTVHVLGKCSGNLKQKRKHRMWKILMILHCTCVKSSWVLAPIASCENF
uniref:Uncharacterized protein n=1 Tax=Vespula pensylvanica TaxID=30213 RepID=A0A834K0Z3_VESPE|nr:hypothetical protein H0235_016121 [Vespula pensylvanica]